MPKHFLVVDDDPSTLKAVSNLFTRHYDEEVTTTCVADPEDALHRFLQDSTEFDLIISDLLMPKMNGLQLCRMIRNENSSIPIVILTGNACDKAYEDASDIGINEFVQKPFQGDSFLDSNLWSR